MVKKYNINLQVYITEACIGVLGIQDICHFYFKGYRILSIFLPGIWDTVLNIFVTFKDIKYLGKLITGIFANLYGILACLLQGIWDIWYPLYKPHYKRNEFMRLRIHLYMCKSNTDT